MQKHCMCELHVKAAFFKSEVKKTEETIRRGGITSERKTFISFFIELIETKLDVDS